MKKIIIAGICLLCLTGCGTSYKEGVYHGSAMDHYGGNENTATAKVTIDSKGKITEVYLDTTYTTESGVEATKKDLMDSYGMKQGNSENGTSEYEWYQQVEFLEKTIVEKQGVKFLKLDGDGYTDAVSGCTIKIDALYAALEDALNQAKK